MADQFKPTHRHAEGGLYQVLNRNLWVHWPTDDYSASGECTWVRAVLYTNETGIQFVRTAEEFNHRMTPLSLG